MESSISYKPSESSHSLILSEAIKGGVSLSKKSLINYILTNNTNAVFPVVDAKSVVPIYPIETYESYKSRINYETDKNIEVMFHKLLVENIEASSKHEKKALLLSGGIDSILVAGILAKNYAPENVRFYHMHHGDFTKGETERARLVSDALNIKLVEVNKGPYTPEDYLKPIQINGHSVDLSSPSYLEICRQINEEQGSDVDVLNGELNLIDVGFSESSDPTRSLRRFIFRHMNLFSTLAPVGWRSIPLLPETNKYSAVLNEIASMIFKKSTKRQFMAGFYTGKAHFPGFYGWENKCGIDHQLAIDQFLNEVCYDYQPDFKRFLYQTAPGFYSGTTNVETIGSFLKHFGMNYVMPYSSPELSAVSLTLPHRVAKNKLIQKRLAVEVYGIARDVAFYLKSHAGYNKSYRTHFQSDAFASYSASEDFKKKYNLLEAGIGNLDLADAFFTLKEAGITDQRSLRLFIAANSFESHLYT